MMLPSYSELMSLIVDPTSVTAWATIVLAGVTIYYAIITNSILNETRKGREIKYVEEKLEKFYLPLQNALRIYPDDEDNGYGRIEEATALNKKLKEVENYNYLASRELRHLIPTFQYSFYCFNHSSESYNTDLAYKKMDGLFGKIDAQINEDIKRCLERIDRLTS